jgi:hypothetical protein
MRLLAAAKRFYKEIIWEGSLPLPLVLLGSSGSLVGLRSDDMVVRGKVNSDLDVTHSSPPGSIQQPYSLVTWGVCCKAWERTQLTFAFRANSGIIPGSLRLKLDFFVLFY